MRSAIYARYSSENQYDRSIEDQIRKCNEAAKRLGWHVEEDHVYTDRALSGKSLAGRAGLLKLISVAKSKKCPFSHVLIEDTSRLSRDRIHQSQIISELKDEGVSIYFVADGIDTRNEIAEDVILPVLGIKDALYCRDLAKRTKRGMEGQVLKGFNAGGRTYGFRYLPVPDPSGVIDKRTHQTRFLGTRIEVDPEQGMVVKSIYSMYADGLGLKAIASQLNNRAIDPPGKLAQERRGRPIPSWCPSAIREMLRNQKYIGDWAWNKYQWTRKRSSGKRVRKERPSEEWVQYRDKRLSIVDEVLWAKVQSRIAENAKRYSNGFRNPRKDYLVSGLLNCGLCGSSLIVIHSGSRDKIKYGCSFNWHRGKKACPNNVRILKSDVENHIIAAIEGQVLQPRIVHSLVAKVNVELIHRQNNLSGSREKLVSTKNALDIQIGNLVESIAQGDMSSSIRRAIDEKEEQSKSLGVEIAKLHCSKLTKPIQTDVQTVANWLKQFKNLLHDDVLSARAQIAKLIGELTAVPISKEGVTGLLLTGKPKIDGVLGIVGGASTSNGSGGRI